MSKQRHVGGVHVIIWHMMNEEEWRLIDGLPCSGIKDYSCMVLKYLKAH